MGNQTAADLRTVVDRGPVKRKQHSAPVFSYQSLVDLRYLGQLLTGDFLFNIPTAEYRISGCAHGNRNGRRCSPSCSQAAAIETFEIAREFLVAVFSKNKLFP